MSKQMATNKSACYSNLDLKDEELIAGGKHVLCVYEMEPADGYSHLEAAADFAAVFSVAAKVEAIATNNVTSNIAPLVYHIDEVSNEIRIAYPLELFYHNMLDDKLMLLSFLSRTIDNYQSKGNITHGQIIDFHVPEETIKNMSDHTTGGAKDPASVNGQTTGVAKSGSGEQNSTIEPYRKSQDTAIKSKETAKPVDTPATNPEPLNTAGGKRGSDEQDSKVVPHSRFLEAAVKSREAAKSVDRKNTGGVDSGSVGIKSGTRQQRKIPDTNLKNVEEVERVSPPAIIGTIPDYTDNAENGVTLIGVTREGAAEKAGVRAGDVILMLGGQKIEDVSDYSKALANLVPGQTIEILVRRNNQEVAFDITPLLR